jgi:hypothetical protein
MALARREDGEESKNSNVGYSLTISTIDPSARTMKASLISYPLISYQLSMDEMTCA